MSGTSDAFSVASDSSLCQSTENVLLTGTLKPDFVGTSLVERSTTIGRDIGNSITDFYLEPQEEGGYVAFSREFRGAVGQGETDEEALADLEEAINLLKQVVAEDQIAQKK
jgi:predicted RNase H-like HicB family nuclease